MFEIVLGTAAMMAAISLFLIGAAMAKNAMTVGSMVEAYKEFVSELMSGIDDFSKMMIAEQRKAHSRQEEASSVPDRMPNWDDNEGPKF